MYDTVRSKFLTVTVAILAVGLLLSACVRAPSQAPAPAAAFTWPKPLAVATGDVASANYMMFAAFADAVLEKGVVVRQVPSGSDPGRVNLLMSGRVHAAVMPIGVGRGATQGLFEFASIEWGPQPLDVILVGVGNSMSGLITAKDANIKTYADLKGKRVALPTGGVNEEMVGASNLAFGGLTWGDVEIVKVSSWGAAGRAVIEGKADAAGAGSVSSWVYELASSPRGVHYPPMPHADVEAWKRAKRILPYYEKIVATSGANLSAANSVETGAYSFAAISVSENSDPALVYNLTRMLNELYPRFKAVPGIESWAPERQTLSTSAPYHQGAIRYYKEVGRWTAENQENNDRLRAGRKVITQAWDKAVTQAAAQKVTAAGFPALWMKVRAEGLEAAGMEVDFREVSLLPKK